MSNLNVESIRKSLRIISTAFDDEIENDIQAFIVDIERVGITTYSTSDSAITLLASLHAKETFNFERDGERYGKAYKSMRNGLSLCDEYNGNALRRENDDV